MPFPALIAAGFTQKEDSQYFQYSSFDASIKYEVTGGFVVSRPRFTRIPNKLIVTGFTSMPSSLKDQFDAFFDSMHGGATPFSYVHPTTAATLNVRFDDVYTTKYTGAGTTFLWDLTSIKLRTV